MFEELRSAFRQAVDNFNKELDRSRVADNVDRHVQGMVDEVAQVRAGLRGLEEEIERAQTALDRERRRAATCRRREELARTVPDEETETIAREHAKKHEERAELLSRKIGLLREELALGKTEADSMMAQLKEARSRRDSLAAAAGRARARDTVTGGHDLFEELDRMADRVVDDSASFSTRIDLDTPPPRPPGPDYDARLAELKRKMGK